MHVEHVFAVVADSPNCVLFFFSLFKFFFSAMLSPPRERNREREGGREGERERERGGGALTQSVVQNHGGGGKGVPKGEIGKGRGGGGEREGKTRRR